MRGVDLGVEIAHNEKMHPRDTGAWGEAAVIHQIIGEGHSVFTEFSDNSPVDLVLQDVDGNLHKVQVKTRGRHKDHPEVTKLEARSSGRDYEYKYTSDMIDWIACVDYPSGKIAWVKMKDLEEEEEESVTFVPELYDLGSVLGDVDDLLTVTAYPSAPPP